MCNRAWNDPRGHCDAHSHSYALSAALAAQNAAIQTAIKAAEIQVKSAMALLDKFTRSLGLDG